jgi:hypothetical protein
MAASAPHAATGAAGRGRLAPGGLRDLVAQRLSERPDLEFTPTQLGHLTGRSSGAIFNALVTLCERGVAVQTQDKPKTFALATPARRRRASRASRGAPSVVGALAGVAAVAEIEVGTASEGTVQSAGSGMADS